jgi:hypothetical protein
VYVEGTLALLIFLLQESRHPMCKAPHVWEISHVRCLISSSHKIKDVKILPDLSLHKDLKAGQSWDFRPCPTLCQALLFGKTPFSGPFSAPYSVLILHKTSFYRQNFKIQKWQLPVTKICPCFLRVLVPRNFWAEEEGGCAKQRGRVPEEQGFARERAREIWAK